MLACVQNPLLSGMGRLAITISTAERSLLSREADLVILPGVQGEMTVLPSHAPLVTILIPGEVRIIENNEEQALFVSGGFLEVSEDKLTVLADAAEQGHDINLERSLEAEQRASKRLSSTDSDLDLERSLRALSRAKVRVKLARRSRSRTPNRNTSESS